MNRIMSFTETWHMLCEVWNLYKKYAVRKISEKELENLIQEAGRIHEKYKYPFTKEIVLAVIGEIERSAMHFDR